MLALVLSPCSVKYGEIVLILVAFFLELLIEQFVRGVKTYLVYLLGGLLLGRHVDGSFFDRFEVFVYTLLLLIYKLQKILRFFV